MAGPDQFGVSFSPTDQQGGDQQQAGRPTPVQQAIQTLSLKIPRVVGAGGLAPQALLNSPGGGNMGGPPDAAAMLEAIKRMLFGGQPGGVPQGQFGTNPPPGGRTGPVPEPGGSTPVPGPGGFQPPEPPPYMPSPSPNPGGSAPQPPQTIPMPGITPGDGGSRYPDPVPDPELELPPSVPSRVGTGGGTRDRRL